MFYIERDHFVITRADNDDVLVKEYSQESDREKDCVSASYCPHATEQFRNVPLDDETEEPLVKQALRDHAYWKRRLLGRN